MIKRLSLYNIASIDSHDIELANWVWNSHYWIEEAPGYFKCAWCNMHQASGQGITSDYPMCRNNPKIRKMLEKEVHYNAYRP